MTRHRFFLSISVSKCNTGMLQGKQTRNHSVLLIKLSLNMNLSVLFNSGYPFVNARRTFLQNAEMWFVFKWECSLSSRGQYLFKNKPPDGTAPPNSFYRALYPKIIQDIEVRHSFQMWWCLAVFFLNLPDLFMMLKFCEYFVLMEYFINLICLCLSRVCRSGIVM